MKKSRVFKLGILGSLAGVFALSNASAAWDIASMLNYWAAAGVFTYILPFLLVFALVFGILTKTKIFDNNTVNAIIALALGLLSLVGDYVPKFFEKLAPNLGIALSVLLAALILGGLFMESVDWLKYVMLGVAAIGFIAVVVSSFSGYQGYTGNLWNEYGPALVTLLILALIVGFLIASGKSGTKPPKT